MSYSAERQGLSQSLRSQMGYGTAPTVASRKSTPRTRKFIKRKLTESETLMGIALKFGVSVQQLKKENKLWTNDSLFLRETLLIPLTSENEECMDEDSDTIVVIEGDSFASSLPGQGATTPSAATSSAVQNGDVFGSSDAFFDHDETVPEESTSLIPRNTFATLAVTEFQKHPARGGGGDAPFATASASSPYSPTSSNFSSSSSLYSSSFSSSHNNSSGLPVKSGYTADPNDFFSKYDSSIAKLKGNVERMENNATNLEGLIESNPLSLPTRKGSCTSTGSTSARKSIVIPDQEDNDGSPVLLIRSRNNSRQIKSTIERSQQASDDLFEL